MFSRFSFEIVSMTRNFARFLSGSRSTVSALLKNMENDLENRTHRRLLSKIAYGNKQLTVAVEGNIGSGKTTFLDHFKKYSNLHIVEEPVHLWQNVRGNNLLDLMYQDASRWSLTFQTYVQLTMIKAHTEQQKQPLKLMERSIYSAKYCFVENLYRSGKMPEVEYIVLTEWFDWLIANLSTDLDLIVYLRTKPEVVHERVIRRKRSEETDIPIEYLRSLHELHDGWLLHDTFGPVSCPILVLDGNLPPDLLREQYEIHRDTILFAQFEGRRRLDLS